MSRVFPQGRAFSLLLILFVAGTLVCQAQVPAPQSTLRGKVLDPNRAAVAGANVIVEAKGRAANFSAVTDQNGEFSLELDLGEYLVRVVADGFSEASETLSVSKNRNE